MNYQSIIMRIVSHAQNQQNLGFRPRTKWAKDSKNFSWCKFQDSDLIPFTLPGFKRIFLESV